MSLLRAFLYSFNIEFTFAVEKLVTIFFNV